MKHNKHTPGQKHILHSEHEQKHGAHSEYTFKDYLPLIGMFTVITLFTLLRHVGSMWNWQSVMSDFMGAFFVLFGGIKLLNWHGFVDAYRTYDIIAKRSKWYAYAYPVIEVLLGIAYLVRYTLVFTNVVTLILMLISAYGVWQAISQKNGISCACLGDLFKIPLTWVTLVEDLLMAGMALAMLLMR